MDTGQALLMRTMLATLGSCAATVAFSTSTPTMASTTVCAQLSKSQNLSSKLGYL